MPASTPKPAPPADAAAARDEVFLDDKALTQRWGWSYRTPATLRSLGTFPIPYVQIGRNVRYKLSDVIAYEQKQTVTPQTTTAA